MNGKAFTEALFNAVIQGQVTQFCEIMKPQPDIVQNWKNELIPLYGKNGKQNILKPRFKVGEKVYLKETYYCNEEFKRLVFRYDCSCQNRNVKWQNKLTMPKRFSRHFIEITGVKAERLQDISDEDCLKEGITTFWHPLKGRNYIYSQKSMVYETQKKAYSGLIYELHSKKAWNRNDYVFRYSFKLLK